MLIGTNRESKRSCTFLIDSPEVQYVIEPLTQSNEPGKQQKNESYGNKTRRINVKWY